MRLSSVSGILDWKEAGMPASLLRLASTTLVLATLSSPLVAQSGSCGTISGRVRDAQGNPLAGWTVHLLDGTGREVAAMTTGVTGQYAFPGLACGNYMVYQEVQWGWSQISPSLATAGAHVVHLASGNQPGLDFRNESGVCAGGGPNLQDFLNSGYDEDAGVTLGANQQIPDDDWLLTARYQQTCWNTQVDRPVAPVAGNLIVEPPRQAVTFCPPFGRTQTCPWALPIDPSQWVSAWTANPAPNGWHFYQHCFCLAESPSPKTIFFRIAADDAAQVLFNGVPVYQTPNPGFQRPEGHPDDKPNVVISSGFRSGTNCITVAVCNNLRVITGFDIAGQVQAHSGTCCIAPPGGRVCGVKWEDLDRDGVRDTGEPVLPGWTIELASAGQPSRTVQTAADGTYCFEDVRAGTYTVSERLPAGGAWAQTHPRTPHQVTVQAGSTVQKIDFGNARCPDPKDPKVVYAVQGDGDRRPCERICCKEGETFFSLSCGCGCEPCQQVAGGTLTATEEERGKPGTVCGFSATFTLLGASGSLTWECASSANGPWSPCAGASNRPFFNFSAGLRARKLWVRVRAVCKGRTAHSNAVTVDPQCAQPSPGGPFLPPGS
jgi:SdrD B-like protein/carboxypeptidase family protein